MSLISSYSRQQSLCRRQPRRRYVIKTIVPINYVQNYFLATAGIRDFNERGSGPSYHISCMSISCRDYLGHNLNQKETFVSFCQAMRVDDQLVRISLRSGNPTGYLLQEMDNDPDATLERLRTALNQIGKPQLFESVLRLNNTSV